MNTTASEEFEWAILKEMRSALLKVIEVQRAQGVIKHSLEARLTMFIDPKMSDYELIKPLLHEAFFKEFLIVSQVEFVQSQGDLEQTIYSGLYARAEHARGVKCPRCWNWHEHMHVHNLCARCADIVNK